MAPDAVLATPFYKWVVATPKPEYAVATAGVRAIGDALAAHRDWAGAPGYDDAVYAARVAAQGLNLYDLEAGDPDFDPNKAPAEYNTRRDRFMAANLVERAGGGSRAAFWAHDLHIYSDIDAVHVKQGYVSVGSELRRMLGTAYVSIGFSWSAGSFNTRDVSGTTAAAVIAAPDWAPLARRNDRPGELGAVLGQTGLPRFWIDLRLPPEAVRAWGRAPYYRGWIGATNKPVPWQSDPDDSIATLPSFDLLVYFRTITPSQMWPKLPVKP